MSGRYSDSGCYAEIYRAPDAKTARAAARLVRAHGYNVREEGLSVLVSYHVKESAYFQEYVRPAIIRQAEAASSQEVKP